VHAENHLWSEIEDGGINVVNATMATSGTLTSQVRVDLETGLIGAYGVIVVPKEIAMEDLERAEDA